VAPSSTGARRSSASGRSGARGYRVRVWGGGGGVGNRLGWVVGDRRARPSERGEEGMMRGMLCGGGGRGVAPFYRVGKVGRGGGVVRGIVGGGGALSRHRLLEGETTGQRRFMGKLKRRR
jgi:hypothetical protein